MTSSRTWVARRLLIGLAAFVIAWVAVSLVARWLFGSGNILVWVLAAVIGLAAYVAVGWRDQRAA
ncbi:MAG TPA: hypothetical protein VFN76_02770 [Candidatus Limnocylindria bacterium]|nr:hypothetical protein [Candidatus Limnocylindria bacterium]